MLVFCNDLSVNKYGITSAEHALGCTFHEDATVVLFLRGALNIGVHISNEEVELDVGTERDDSIHSINTLHHWVLFADFI